MVNNVKLDRDYHKLQEVLEMAFNQAARGKGKERHAEPDEKFEKQIICEVGRRLKDNIAAGPLFQAVKKVYESGRLPAPRAINELLGAIVYITAAITLIQENDVAKEVNESPDSN